MADIANPTQTQTPARRGARVFHRMRIQAQGKDHARRRFKEICETVVVNAHGGLLVLKHEVENGEILIITNPETQEEQECRVVYLGDVNNKGVRVGVEFLTPAPRFWGVEFSDGNAPSAVH
jgi:hypothetical protein